MGTEICQCDRVVPVAADWDVEILADADVGVNLAPFDEVHHRGCDDRFRH